MSNLLGKSAAAAATHTVTSVAKDYGFGFVYGFVSGSQGAISPASFNSRSINGLYWGQDIMLGAPYLYLELLPSTLSKSFF